MTIAVAWAELAKQERAAHRKKWGTIAQQDKQPKPEPQISADSMTIKIIICTLPRIYYID